MITPCLTLSNIRCISRVKWSNPGKGVAPSPTRWCSSYCKGNLLDAPSTMVANGISTLDGYLMPNPVFTYISSAIYWVFGMTWPGIETQSPGPLANTLPTRPMGWYIMGSIGLVGNVFTNKLRSQVESYQRIKKMVLVTSLLNTQHYKVCIKGKVEQSKERRSAFPNTSV